MTEEPKAPGSAQQTQPVTVGSERSSFAFRARAARIVEQRLSPERKSMSVMTAEKTVALNALKTWTINGKRPNYRRRSDGAER